MRTEPDYVQKIVDMYSAGIEQKSITEATGQSYFTVRYWLKKKGLYDPERRVHNISSAHKAVKINEERKQEAENKIALFLLDKGFTYISGYSGRYSTLQISCQKCGGIFERYCDHHFRAKGTIECPCCAKNAKALRQAQEDAERAQRREEYEKQLETWRKAREERELEKVRKMDEPHVCPICSKTFTIREYAESIGTDPIFISKVEYCSDKCRHKGRKTEGHIERAKLHGCEWERGVTLSKLIKRDGLRCAICGELCDINDKSYGNGSGPLYPSMDHRIPIAKGGSHMEQRASCTSDLQHP